MPTTKRNLMAAMLAALILMSGFSALAGDEDWAKASKKSCHAETCTCCCATDGKTCAEACKDTQACKDGKACEAGKDCACCCAAGKCVEGKCAESCSAKAADGKGCAAAGKEAKGCSSKGAAKSCSGSGCGK
jgi:hypothetical protein